MTGKYSDWGKRIGESAGEVLRKLSWEHRKPQWLHTLQNTLSVPVTSHVRARATTVPLTATRRTSCASHTIDSHGKRKPQSSTSESTLHKTTADSMDVKNDFPLISLLICEWLRAPSADMKNVCHTLHSPSLQFVNQELLMCLKDLSFWYLATKKWSIKLKNE